METSPAALTPPPSHRPETRRAVRLSARLREVPWTLLATFLGVGLSVHFAAKSIEVAVLHFAWSHLAVATVLVALAFGMLVLAFCLRRSWLPVLHLETKPVTARKVLILFLSPQRPWVRLRWENDQLQVAGGGALAADLKTEIDALDTDPAQRWNWTPILRGIQPHFELLERIHVICSPASLGDLPVLRSFLRFFKPGLEVIPSGPPVNFEDYDALRQALKGILARESGTPGHEIIIDVTGGQKTSSIAGAAVTLAQSELAFQYVGTNADTKGGGPGVYAVTEYNLVASASPSGAE